MNDDLFLEYKINALADLTTDRLDDAALELQVDLEMWRFDEDRKSNRLPYDPYDDFVAFAGEVADDPWDKPDSALNGLTASQLRLVAAWNFLTISREITRDDLAPAELVRSRADGVRRASPCSRSKAR